MTVSRSKRFVFLDEKESITKKQVFIFGSIIASGCISGAFLIALYIEYLHNPAFHSFVQSRGIFL
jgi:hydroxyethylthiazole kinase-like sugar kinase family protein